ncbi:hypothetical protein K438DRAFT_1975701 [Mycena galopus ATCC 62051]|nr:hypothetical protein K438DRAFT_1975701 [Mycena galopus ATCC 62051]
MTQKGNTRSSSNENHNPRPCARSKPSRVPTASSACAPPRDRNVTTDEGGQTISTTPSPEHECARIARLEAELEAMKAQHDRADAALRAERQRAPVPRCEHNIVADESIPRPSNAAKVKMEALREMLDIEKMDWNAIHTATRDALTAAQLDTERNWKAQKLSKLAMAYNTVEEKFPVLRQCEGQWGVDRIAKQTLSNRKSYQSCVRNPVTYRGRHSPCRFLAHLFHPRPVSSPLSICWTIPAADEDLMDLNDNVQDNGEEDNEPELSRSEGKKRAALPDERARKRSRRD